MPVIYVIATIRTHPGKMPELLPHVREVVKATNENEPGCLLYQAHQSVMEPDTLRMVEQWKSREDLAGHFEMEHMKAWRAANAPLVAERKVEIITPAAVEVK
ncbi:MAG TPA: putative quinol monooxygenase [Pseudorhodoplanes sp.]|nr:putative quinol monooxygenase [Pseudorhodoplanes sp.]